MTVTISKKNNQNCLIPPIIIIGTNRSGKSLLARCLSYLETVYWWSEPNSIWRIGNASSTNDRRSPFDATIRVKTLIRQQYLQKQKSEHNRRIVDDSPLNCINVPFIRSVFPEAKLIHVFRDGWDVMGDVLES